MAQDERIEFHRSRARFAGLLALSASFVAGGYFMVDSERSFEERMLGWVTIAFFGLAGLVFVRQLFRGGVALTLTQGGIISDDIPVGVIPWSEIESCDIVTVRGNRFLAISFRDRETYLARVAPRQRKLAALNERMGWGHWAISFTGLVPGIDEALRFIRSNISDVRVPPA